MTLFDKLVPFLGDAGLKLNADRKPSHLRF